MNGFVSFLTYKQVIYACEVHVLCGQKKQKQFSDAACLPHQELVYINPVKRLSFEPVCEKPAV